MRKRRDPLGPGVKLADGAWFWLRRNTPVEMRVSAGGRVGSTSRKRAVWISVIFEEVLVGALNWKIGLSAPLRLVTFAATSFLVAQLPAPVGAGQLAVMAEVSAGSAPPATPVCVWSQSPPLDVL